MNGRPSIEQTLAEIGQQLAGDMDRSTWIGQTNAASLRSLEEKYTSAALGRGRRARLRFTSGRVVGSAAPAHLLLKFVSEINDAVVAVANNRLVRPYRTIDDSVRERLGLWMYAAQPGSVIFEIASPPLPTPGERVAAPDNADVPLPGVDQIESVSDVAMSQILLSLQMASEPDMDSDLLASHLASLGSSAVAHLNRLAARSEEGDFIVGVVASGGDEPTVSFDFRPRDAAFMRSVIRLRELDRVVREVEGWLTTASRRRSIFDIESDDGEVVSGAVPAALRPQVAGLFDQRVIAQVEEFADPADPEGTRVKRKLLGLAAVPEPDQPGTLLP